MRYQIFSDLRHLGDNAVAVPLEQAPVILTGDDGETLFPCDVVSAGSPGEAVCNYLDQWN